MALKFDGVVSTDLNDELIKKSVGHGGRTSSSNALLVDNKKKRKR